MSDDDHLAADLDAFIAEHRQRGNLNTGTTKTEPPRVWITRTCGARIVVADATEQATLARITALRGAGASLRGISAALAGEGILAGSGRPFAPSLLLRLVHERAVVNSQSA